MSTTVNIVSHATDALASHRMRVQIPADNLNSYTTFKTKISERADAGSDINIFHKHFRLGETLTDAVMISDISKTVFDICDDYFDKEQGDYYMAMCDTAHVITCNTPNMQNRIYDVTGRLAQICSDPITFPYHAPSEHTKTPDILWYGHASNIFSVVPYVAKIDNLTVISNILLQNPKVKSKFWKPGLVEKTIDLYEVVIIPRISTPEAKYKSPNRAIDALHAGRFVIAESEEVYGELVDFIFLGSIEEGIDFYKRNPQEVEVMIKNGQQYALDNYNHKKVCEQWVSALNYEDYSRYEKD